MSMHYVSPSIVEFTHSLPTLTGSASFLLRKPDTLCCLPHTLFRHLVPHISTSFNQPILPNTRAALAKSFFTDTLHQLPILRIRHQDHSPASPHDTSQSPPAPLGCRSPFLCVFLYPSQLQKAIANCLHQNRDCLQAKYGRCIFFSQIKRTEMVETYKVALLQRHEFGGTLVLGYVLVVFEDAGAVD